MKRGAYTVDHCTQKRLLYADLGAWACTLMSRGLVSLQLEAPGSCVVRRGALESGCYTMAWEPLHLRDGSSALVYIAILPRPLRGSHLLQSMQNNGPKPTKIA